MARTRVARFNIMITASANQVRQVFTKLSDQSRKWATSFTASLTSMSFAWNQISTAITPLASRFADIASEIDVIGKASDRLRVAPEFLQAISLASTKTGIELSRVETGLQALQERLGDFRLGTGTAGKALETLGLSGGNLSTDLQTAFTQIRDQLAAVEDQTVKASLAVELFGRAGREMLALFETSDAIGQASQRLKEMNAELTREDIARVEAFNDAWADLTVRFKAITQVVVTQIAPALLKLTQWIERMIEGLQQLNQVASESQTIKALLSTFGGGALALELLGTGASPGRGGDSSLREQKRQTGLLSEILRENRASRVVVTEGGL